MTIVFSLQNFGFLRNFQSTVGLLAERGHRIHLVADRTDNVGGMQMVTSLADRYPGVTYEILAPARRGLWLTFTNVVRVTIDYWRYLDPRFKNAAQLRERARQQVPAALVLLPNLPLLRTAGGRRLLTRGLRAVERVLPPRRDVAELMARRRPDLLLLTPLLYFGSKQVDYVRVARQLGVPSVLGVGSWDHLTTKGLIHEIPDRVVVWNEMQRREAAELHGVDPARVVVTGAQAYDHWFATTVSTTREEFCARVGLPADRPYLLYLCSSPFITPHEVPFIRRWIAAIRASETPEVRALGLLIRPHPQNAEQWRGVELGDPLVAIWPRAGANPIDTDARREYYDSMYHSHAVVGVNTSALIESGIVGRRVYSLLAEEFSGTQEGTLHFQHLKNVEGGLLRLARTFEEHIAQIAPTLERAEPGEDAKVRSFVQAFVRPHGLDVVATTRVVEAVEEAGTVRVEPRPVPALASLAQVFLSPVALAVLAASYDAKAWQGVRARAVRPFRRAGRAVWRAVYAGYRVSRSLAHETRRVAGRGKRIVIRPVRWAVHRWRGTPAGQASKTSPHAD